MMLEPINHAENTPDAFSSSEQHTILYDLTSDAGHGVAETGSPPCERSTSFEPSSGTETSQEACLKIYSQQECRTLLASCLAALGGLMFGYDTGIISGALLQLEDTFKLSCHDKELVVSVMLIGALIAALLAGTLVDRIGRRLAVIINAVIFTVGSATLAASVSFPMMIFGRLIIGFGVSLSAIAECIYISEISPADRRGFLVSLNEFSITVGFLLAFLVNYLLIHVNDGWRYMFGLGAIPALIQGVGMIFMPKSPRYLLLQNDEYQARNVLLQLRCDTDVDAEMREIQEAVSREKKLGYKDLIKVKDNMIGRMMIGLVLVIFQQITGQPNILYYAPTVFQQIGFRSSSSATLATVALGIVKVLFTGFSLYHLDRWGRRHLLIAGATIMMLSILTLGTLTAVSRLGFSVSNPCPSVRHNGEPPINGSLSHNLYFHRGNDTTSGGISAKQNDLLASMSVRTASKELYSTMSGVIDFNSTGYSMGEPPWATVTSKGLPTASFSDDITDMPVNDINSTSVLAPADLSTTTVWMTLVSFLIFVAGYALGFGPGTWLVLSEIFPSTIRGRAMSCAVVFNWLFNLIITSTFLDTMSTLGVSTTFLCYGVVCGFSIIFIVFFVPETKGKSLEEINSELQKWPVKLHMRERLCCQRRTSSSIPVRYQRINSEINPTAEL